MINVVYWFSLWCTQNRITIFGIWVPRIIRWTRNFISCNGVQISLNFHDLTVCLSLASVGSLSPRPITLSCYDHVRLSIRLSAFSGMFAQAYFWFVQAIDLNLHPVRKGATVSSKWLIVRLLRNALHRTFAVPEDCFPWDSSTIIVLLLERMVRFVVSRWNR